MRVTSSPEQAIPLADGLFSIRDADGWALVNHQNHPPEIPCAMVGAFETVSLPRFPEGLEVSESQAAHLGALATRLP